MTSKLTAQETCVYDEAWAGACGDPAVESDPPRCDEHAEKTCASCGAPATGGCEATFGLVCGAPLCDDCEMSDCPVHPRGGL